MRRKVVLRVVIMVTAVLALTACEGIKQQLGTTKQSPDEFMVVSRAPLTVPPEFTLRPPQPGIPRPQEGTTSQQARNALFRLQQPKAGTLEPEVGSGGRSPGELSLLRAVGADNTDPNIRRIVDRETQQLNIDSEDFLESLVFWRDPAMPGEIVDATEETKRLRENSALGKPVTAGATPTIERKKKALLEGLF